MAEQHPIEAARCALMQAYVKLGQIDPISDNASVPTRTLFIQKLKDIRRLVDNMGVWVGGMGSVTEDEHGEAINLELEAYVGVQGKPSSCRYLQFTNWFLR